MKSKISASKGSFIPCCYFPTLTILIDDNARFLQGLQRFLGKEKSTEAFDNPSKVFNFIEQHKNAHNVPLYAQFTLKEGDRNLPGEPIQINISEIYKILLRKDRFEEPGIVVVDYAMPGMNGIEVSQKIKNDSFSPVKIVMLTGEADEHTAVNAFNDGIIDKFIKKSAEDCLVKVKEYIADLEIKYFQDMSRTIAESFRARSNFILEEPDFINLFNKICEENKIIEYYLLDDSGSFIMLDETGNITRLIVKTEEDMRMLCDLASDEEGVSIETLKKLEDRKGLVYFHNRKSQLGLAKGWRLEEATLIKGRKNYYYSIIKGIKDYPLETKKDILSYAQYLKSKKHNLNNR